MILRIGFCLMCLCMAFPAAADTMAVDASHIGTARPEDYIKPTWGDLLRTMIRFNAIDLGDDNLLDGYAAVAECELYSFYYKDDFKWNQVRKSIRQSTEMNLSNYPVYYHFDTELQLDRYDFRDKIYRFQEKSIINKVNLFRIYDVIGSSCGDEATRFMPRSFQAAADTTINMAGLPLAPADAQALLRQMNEDKNSERYVFMRVNMTVTYIARLHREVKDVRAGGINRNTIYYFQSREGDTRLIRFDVRLDSINFYEDPKMTKLVYSYKPEGQ